MLLNEAGLVRSIKHAYKSGGYTVVNNGDTVSIYTMSWFVHCKWERLPRKALAVIVEHAGMIPEKHAPVAIEKDYDLQMVIPEEARQDISNWYGGEFTDSGFMVTYVPVTVQGFQIFQQPDGGSCWGVDMFNLNIIERDNMAYDSARIANHNRMRWEGSHDDVEIAIFSAKKNGGHLDEWERGIWDAPESVDLHKKVE